MRRARTSTAASPLQNDAASCASSDSQALSFSMLVGMMVKAIGPSFDMSGVVRGARALQ